MKKKESDKKNRSFESNSDPLPSGEKRIRNSPKRSRTEKKLTELINDSIRDKSSNEMEITNLENVASQITIEGSFSPALPNKGVNNRLEFINSQKNTRYSSSNYPLYLVHIETIDDNIGNVHPMRLGKVLAEHFPAIQSIKRLGIITVNFKFSFDANQFA